MAQFFRQNPIAFALAALAAVLVIVIGIEVALALWPSTAEQASRAAPASEVKMLPPLAASVVDQAYPETAARPLFTPTRRPAPAAPSVTNTMVKGQFTLTGVLALRDQRIALLREKTSGKVHRVERGKEINGMTLTAVEGEKVTLSQGGDEEVLTLQTQKGNAPGPTAAAAAPAPVAAPTAGFFGAPGAGGPVAQVPGGPGPGPTAAPAVTPPVPTGIPAPAQPAVAGQPVNPQASNPAQRSGFGPFMNQPSANPSEATPMTPEELLARRRARRGTQQPNQ